MITEIRVYKLKAHRATEFNTIFTTQVLPMLKCWNVVVVNFNVSLIDSHCFHIIRSYESLEQRKESQDAFYGSDEWIHGPEKAVMNCIDFYNTSVVDGNIL